MLKWARSLNPSAFKRPLDGDDETYEEETVAMIVKSLDEADIPKV